MQTLRKKKKLNVECAMQLHINIFVYIILIPNTGYRLPWLTNL